MLEFEREPNHILNDLTCLALGKVAHLKDMVEVVEPAAVQLLKDVQAAAQGVSD